MSSQTCKTLFRFDFNRSMLKPEHIAILKNIARDILARNVKQVTLTGHTDPAGSDEFNFNLGKKRAANVAFELRKELNRLKSGSGNSIQMMILSEGEKKLISTTDQGLNRRVAICLLNTALPVPGIPVPGPIRTAVFKVTAKSFIMTIGSRVGSLSGVGCNSTDDLQLRAFGVFLDRIAVSNPITDTKDKQYRLYSTYTFTIIHNGSGIISVAPVSRDTDVGDEKIATPPPLIPFVPLTINRISSTRFKYRWGFKGQPDPRIAERAFQLVCPRTSTFIWHIIEGEIDLSGGVVTVAARIKGSQFPSHRAYINGMIRDFKRQGFLSDLWVPTPGNPTLVREMELAGEDEYNLKANIPWSSFRKYKDNLRAQARRMARNPDSGVSDQRSGFNVHHRIPLKYAHLMKSQNAKYKLNKNFAHPNSPGNLVNASLQAHNFIHRRMNEIFNSKEFKDALANAKTDLERKNLIRSVRAHVENQARKLNLKLVPIKTQKMTFQNNEYEY